ncbi:TRAP transporter small permease subunit [Rhodobacter sp. Har01]|uniref:TRAP transporter small permease subunit n=1 Tax=Rhodobacter sp. Har01 TaxID=2883999 RepID=UPI001D08D21A|nr:TRAP transporter small permease subunit [Rhodobacter sp. Har01]MCB6178441.1 TRAP transporter small permease subunit [Rhodobacter sp. Har01]
MPRALIAFVHLVEKLNYGVGRFAMYLLFVLMAVLMWSSISKAMGAPSLWTLEMAQFVMVAYYVLGGPYAWQLGTHVRMDLFYARQSVGSRALWDAFTVLAVIFYLGVMLYGAIDATAYSFEYGERSPTAWRPYLWPVKVTMVIGFLLMLLQALASLIRDIAHLRGVSI